MELNNHFTYTSANYLSDTEVELSWSLDGDKRKRSLMRNLADHVDTGRWYGVRLTESDISQPYSMRRFATTMDVVEFSNTVFQDSLDRDPRLTLGVPMWANAEVHHRTGAAIVEKELEVDAIKRHLLAAANKAIEERDEAIKQSEAKTWWIVILVSIIGLTPLARAFLEWIF